MGESAEHLNTPAGKAEGRQEALQVGLAFLNGDLARLWSRPARGRPGR